MSFLKAEWKKLILVNYEVPSEILEPFLPYGTELDLWRGKCYVSLVGFMFQNTRLLGIKIPFHVNFEEVNLRFYVKYHDEGQWKRGVVFVKEIVPRYALSWVANTVYKEHYETLPMDHSWDFSAEKQAIAYSWKKKGQHQEIRVIADQQPLPISPGSETEFITEHYWGYTRINDQKTSEYEVVHPRWEAYTILEYQINVDFQLNYGQPFELLNHRSPVSVMLAEGSAVSVEPKKAITQ